MSDEARCNECGTLSKITNQRFEEYEEKVKLMEIWSKNAIIGIRDIDKLNKILNKTSLSSV